MPFPHHFIPLDGRRTERSWPVPSCDCASLTAVRRVDGHLRTQISSERKFQLHPKSQFSQYNDIRFPPRLLYYLCASRLSLHHSKTDRPQHRLPCSLKTALTPFTDRPSSTPASLLSQESFYAVHGLFSCQCRFPCSFKSQECLSTSRSV